MDRVSFNFSQLSPKLHFSLSFFGQFEISDNVFGCQNHFHQTCIISAFFLYKFSMNFSVSHGSSGSDWKYQLVWDARQPYPYRHTRMFLSSACNAFAFNFPKLQTVKTQIFCFYVSIHTGGKYPTTPVWKWGNIPKLGCILARTHTTNT